MSASTRTRQRSIACAPAICPFMNLDLKSWCSEMWMKAAWFSQQISTPRFAAPMSFTSALVRLQRMTVPPICHRSKALRAQSPHPWTVIKSSSTSQPFLSALAVLYARSSNKIVVAMWTSMLFRTLSSSGKAAPFRMHSTQTASLWVLLTKMSR